MEPKQQTKVEYMAVAHWLQWQFKKYLGHSSLKIY